MIPAILIGAMGSAFGVAFAGGAFPSATPTHVENHLVVLGGGQKDDYVNLQYTPNVMTVYAGDSVSFVNNNPTEPHTVTFGPKKMIEKLVAGFVTPVPSSNGPPVLKFTTAAVVATKSNVVKPGKFVNSGVLSGEYHGITKKSWTAKFPVPGKYEYYCLVHGTSMHGWVVVLPRPGVSTHYTIIAGPNTPSPTVADVFQPDQLTVKVGTTVTWESFFHTVTFGSMAQIHALRHKFVLKSGQGSKAVYQLNPQVAFPSVQGCGTPSAPCSYSGGWMNSGLLQGSAKGPATWSMTFTTPGTYVYGCLVHPGMDAVIKVVA